MSAGSGSAPRRLEWHEFDRAMGDAARTFDRERAQAIAETLIERFDDEGADEHAKDVSRVLAHLRRQRWFPLLARVSTAFLEAAGEKRVPRVQLQRVQALIEQGRLELALDEAMDLRENADAGSYEDQEARGLIGRINKQAYVDGRQRQTAARVRRLQAAVGAYWTPYQRVPDENWWHGINVVACLARGERDGVPVAEITAPLELDRQVVWPEIAEEILERVSSYSSEDLDYTWAAATALEACIALGRVDEAREWTERYIRAPYANAFELASTERQLRQVWSLEERDVATGVLAALRGKTGQEGGEVDLPAAVDDLVPQAQFGNESTQAIRWMDLLLHRAASVAKVMKATDDEHSGTGFFVETRDLGGRWEPAVVLVTNYHVVNGDGAGTGMRPETAVAKLTRAEKQPERRISRVLWESRELDVSICDVEVASGEVTGIPLGRVQDLTFGTNGATPRLYVVGHPNGSDLRISLHDNHLVECDMSAGHLRYRSPTEKGSSGSPVLTKDLEVVAVHHAARLSLAANQGVLLDAVRSKTQP